MASAKRLTTGGKVKRAIRAATDWQADAWDMYDLVGEQRFLSTTIAGRLAQARFFIGTQPQSMTDDVEPVEPAHVAAKAFEALSDRPASFVQMIYRLALNLSIPGEAYLVGTPRKESDGSDDEDDYGPDEYSFTSTYFPSLADRGETDGISNEGVPIEELDWRCASVEEIEVTDDKTIKVKLDPDDPEEYDEDDVFLIRVWRPHPRRHHEPDSPTRSSLPVLRELVALTMDISAKVDSRLAGAGLLLVPESARQALARATAQDGESPDEVDDPLTDALIEAMTTPISERDSAAAVVPLVLSVPDDVIEKFRHMTFRSELDTVSHTLREEAIRRLALGQDCPPELLLGVGSMNHWGAWLVREDVVTTHIEPTLALICDALTTEYLWPVLTDPTGLNMTEDEARQYVVWYSVEHLIVRPNRTADAKDLHAAGVISDDALRENAGFDEGDAPEGGVDTAVALALDMIKTAPSLASDPGISALVAQIREALGGPSAPDVEGPEGDVAAPEGTGAESDDDSGGSEGELPNADDSTGPEVLEEVPA